MHPTDIIKQDHRRVEDLFRLYEDLDDLAHDERRLLADQILEELEFHAEMEESLVYPRFFEAFAGEDDKMVDEAFAEHEVAKRLIDDLKSLSPEEPEFGAKMKVLKEAIEHHVEEEEEELLPKAEEKVSGEAMAEIGEAMLAFREAKEDIEKEVLEDY